MEKVDGNVLNQKKEESTIAVEKMGEKAVEARDKANAARATANELSSQKDFLKGVVKDQKQELKNSEGVLKRNIKSVKGRKNSR